MKKRLFHISDTNVMDLVLLVIVKQSFFFLLYPLFIHNDIKGREGLYIWYQSEVKMLGPDGLINMQV